MSSESSGIPTRVWVPVTLAVALINAGGSIIASRSDLIPGINGISGGGNPNTYTFSLRIGDFKDISWPEDSKTQFLLLMGDAPKRITYLELVKKASDGILTNLKADIGAKFKINSSGDRIFISPGVVRLDDTTLVIPVNCDAIVAATRENDRRLTYFLKLHVEHINPYSGEVTLRVFVMTGGGKL